MLAHVSEYATQRRALRLRRRIVPTAKNAPVRDLYERHGFRSDPDDGTGQGQSSLALSTGGIAYLEWMKIVSKAG